MGDVFSHLIVSCNTLVGNTMYLYGNTEIKLLLLLLLLTDRNTSPMMIGEI